ncbi:MAG: WecB/TagA/CpsF family glycosyltransferase [Methylobacterium sp.]
MQSYRILDVDVIDQPLNDALALMQRLVRAEGPRSLFFVNAHTLNEACRDPGYRAVLRRASRIYGDGTGVRWAARLSGLELRANLNGTDLVPALLEQGQGLRCFLIGSRPERIARILATVRRRFPDVEFVGAHHGYVDDAQSRALVAEVQASRANLVLVGMGNPLQERWIDRHGADMPGALCIGVGGLFEYWSGSLTRAPIWIRRQGMEWAYLMLRQPWKARRYLLGNPLYIARVLASRWAHGPALASLGIRQNPLG